MPGRDDNSGRTWIDFENEIRYVVSELRVRSNDPDVIVRNLKPKSSTNETRMDIFFKYVEKRKILDKSLLECTESLFTDLQNFSEALEIYLSYFVERLYMTDKRFVKKPEIENLHFDSILSFNYTHTFEKYSKGIDTCYIHGEVRRLADIVKEDSTSNIVLGINEYLLSEGKDEFSVYDVFMKFIQRIRNHNSTKYFQWDDEMHNDYEYVRHFLDDTVENQYKDMPNGISDVWVYGHSLDSSDADILRRFLKPEYTRIHIFYRKEKPKDSGRLATHLKNIIGEETMIRKSGTYHPMLEFIGVE